MPPTWNCAPLRGWPNCDCKVVRLAAVFYSGDAAQSVVVSEASAPVVEDRASAQRFD